MPRKLCMLEHYSSSRLRQKGTLTCGPVEPVRHALVEMTWRARYLTLSEKVFPSHAAGIKNSRPTRSRCLFIGVLNVVLCEISCNWSMVKAEGINGTSGTLSLWLMIKAALIIQLQTI